MTKQPVAEPERVPIQDGMKRLECSRSTIYAYIRTGDLRVLARRPADKGRTMLDGSTVEALRSRCFATDEAAS